MGSQRSTSPPKSLRGCRPRNAAKPLACAQAAGEQWPAERLVYLPASCCDLPAPKCLPDGA